MTVILIYFCVAALLWSGIGAMGTMVNYFSSEDIADIPSSEMEDE